MHPKNIQQRQIYLKAWEQTPPCFFCVMTHMLTEEESFMHDLEMHNDDTDTIYWIGNVHRNMMSLSHCCVATLVKTIDIRCPPNPVGG